MVALTQELKEQAKERGEWLFQFTCNGRNVKTEAQPKGRATIEYAATITNDEFEAFYAWWLGILKKRKEATELEQPPTLEDERDELVNYGEFMRAMHDEAPNDKAREYFNGQADYADKRLQHIKGRGLDECYHKAMHLLERAVATEMPAPDKTWFQEYFALTGEHMILTDEGWTSGNDKAACKPEEILDEVNAPSSN